jgi:hypothetical protein
MKPMPSARSRSITRTATAVYDRRTRTRDIRLMFRAVALTLRDDQAPAEATDAWTSVFENASPSACARQSTTTSSPGLIW